MITIDVPKDDLRALERSLENAAKDLPRECSIAINETTKATERSINKEVRRILAVKASVVKKEIARQKRATRRRLQSGVVVAYGFRLPLRDFKPRQTRRGVTYKIDKTKGRSLATDAFMGAKPGQPNPKLGGHAFKRMGQSRYPIEKMHGASVWGVYQKRNIDTPTRQEAVRDLRKRIERRVRFNVLKRQGLI